MELFFWLTLSIILYTYFGYILILVILFYVKKIFCKDIKNSEITDYPKITVLIASYNERSIIEQKIENLRNLDYPKDKITFLWVTDGSDDGSYEILSTYPDMKVIHENERKGKVGAINRGIKYVDTDIVLFCDANTLLSKGSIKAIVEEFSNPSVGCVTGEKRIISDIKDFAPAAGEEIYWKYESLIKLLESKNNSTIGAVGEFCAIRTSLFEPLEPDTILDDFIISLRIAQKGYKIKYSPYAIAMEWSSESIKEELKRKVRIAAGSIQTLIRLKSLLNIFQYGFLSFQYWSHKVLRWIIVPFAIFLLLPINIALVLIDSSTQFYIVILIMQTIFYILALVGYFIHQKKIFFKLLFAPYYILIMNYAQIIGIIRFFKQRQSVNWEKSKRISN